MVALPENNLIIHPIGCNIKTNRGMKAGRSHLLT